MDPGSAVTVVGPLAAASTAEPYRMATDMGHLTWGVSEQLFAFYANMVGCGCVLQICSPTGGVTETGSRVGVGFMAVQT